jgi:RhtB (resistance to homoserine/threonine) family protein
MFIAQFITVAVIHLLAVISPGPDFAMVTRNSLTYNRKTGILTALGIALGIMVHVGYSLLGIGFLIARSIVLFNIIKYIGAAYLIYIGWKSLRAKPQVISADQVDTNIQASEKSISTRSALWTGFLTNVLNPKATLFFLALFTQIINPVTPKFVQFLFGIEMMVLTFFWFTVVTIFFSNKYLKVKITRVQHHIERVTGAVLIALGIKVALSGQK